MNLLTAQEAANELRLSIHTIRAWVQKKRIPYIRMGRKMLFKREDLEELVRKNTVNPMEEVHE